jgi:hypothetical protein
VIAAIGGIPAVATAAAGATAQLALGLGQGLAGGAAVGIPAIYGAVGALKAYTAAISSTVSASREAYFTLNEQREEQLEQQRATILNTQASQRFNQQIDRTTIALSRWQALIGRAAFPIFTRELRAWTNLMPTYNDYLSQTVTELARIGGGFSRWLRHAQDGRLLQETFQFINASAQNAARTLDHLGRAGGRTFQLLIPYATNLQERIVGVARAIDRWTQQDQNMQRLNGIIEGMYSRFNQLLRIVRNFGSGLVGVFTALWNQGGPQRLMNGLEGLSEGFDRLMAKGNGARQAIGNFMNRSQPALNQLWKLTGEVVVEFGKLANNVVKAGQAGGKMGTLAEVIAGIRKSIGPLRKMFQETFIALAPVLARLTPELVKFMTVFLGSTGPLVTFLRAATTLLRIFNSMPGPVKTLVANLVALKAILGGLGIGSLVGSLVRARVGMSALSVATGRQVTTMGLLRQAFLGTSAAATTSSTATAATGTAAAASAGRFGRLGGVVAAAGRGLLTFGRFAGPVGIVLATLATAAIIVAKNWDRIKAAVAPATRGIQAFLNAVRPVVRELRGALGQALGAMVNGFIQAVSPSKNLGDATRSLASVFGRLARAAIPPVVAGLRAVGNWLEEHQRAFRIVGQVVGTVVVSGFRVWGAVLRTTWRIISGTVKVIGTLINVVRRVTEATASATRSWGQSLRRFGSSAMRIIRQFGSGFLKLWQTSIWGRAAKFLIERARGMVRTLSNWRGDAVRWVRSLIPNVGRPWEKFWQGNATFLSQRKAGERRTLSNFLGDAVSWVKSFPGRVGTLWKKFWQGSADFVVKIKDGILNTMGNLVSGVIGFWNKLIGFINSVLKAVGLDPIGVSGGGSGGGGTTNPGGTSNDDTIAAGQMGRARGGLDSGKYSDPRGRTHIRGTEFMARGGVADGRRPRVVYGEAGPEAYVTLGRYTKESAEALTKANSVWAKNGWLDRARRERGSRNEGEGLGPTTYDLVDSVREKANAIASATGTKWNTYVGHGRLGGSTQQYTADFWGPGGRGDPLSKEQGYRTASLALEKYNSNPPILYMIRQGEYWRNGAWSGNTFGDPHYDHTHISWDSPGGASAGDAGLSIWDTIGNAMWNRLVQPRVDSMVKSLSTGFVLRQAAGKAIDTTANSIKNWIIGQVGSSGGSTALGGDAAENRALGEELFKASGVGGSFSSLDQLWMRESGWDRFARNPSSGAYGIPQALPESKLPAAGQRSGGSKAGPQIDWGLNYIRGRYGSTDAAWKHSQSTGWYSRGGIIPGVKGRQVMIQAHAGERVLPTDMVKSFDRLAQTVQNWSRSVGGHRTGRMGVSVGPQGVFMPGLSVTARGIQINPRQLHRGAFAQEDAAKTLRRVERRLGDLDKRIGKEVREGINRNVERGLNTNRALDKSDARRLARQLAGGPRISRAL